MTGSQGYFELINQMARKVALGFIIKLARIFYGSHISCDSHHFLVFKVCSGSHTYDVMQPSTGSHLPIVIESTLGSQ